MAIQPSARAAARSPLPGGNVWSWAAAVLCDLVPGGHPKEISAAQAARILAQASPSGAVALARGELAAEFLADLRHLDGQLRDTRKKLAAAVRASGTSLTQVFGVGPVIAGTIAGDVSDVARFPGRDHFESYRGSHAEVGNAPGKGRKKWQARSTKPASADKELGRR